MQLEELFKVQKVLRDRINYNEPDRFNKLVLALLVELGELAQEWRGFKFWSKNQQPRTKAVRNVAMNEEDKEYYNPLLEEYVDGLHFVLELGLEIGFDDKISLPSFVYDNTLDQFNELYYQVSYLGYMQRETGVSSFMNDYYYDMLMNYFNLGKLLGFTWEQIEESYLEKNKINHARQDSGVY